MPTIQQPQANKKANSLSSHNQDYTTLHSLRSFEFNYLVQSHILWTADIIQIITSPTSSSNMDATECLTLSFIYFNSSGHDMFSACSQIHAHYQDINPRELPTLYPGDVIAAIIMIYSSHSISDRLHKHMLIMTRLIKFQTKTCAWC